MGKKERCGCLPHGGGFFNFHVRSVYGESSGDDTRGWRSGDLLRGVYFATVLIATVAADPVGTHVEGYCTVYNTTMNRVTGRFNQLSTLRLSLEIPG